MNWQSILGNRYRCTTKMINNYHKINMNVNNFLLVKEKEVSLVSLINFNNQLNKVTLMKFQNIQNNRRKQETTTNRAIY